MRAYALAIEGSVPLLLLRGCVPAVSADSMSGLHFELRKTFGAARLGVLHHRAATSPTSAFMPVGTAASVKAMLPESVRFYGRRYRARQHLSPDAAAGEGADRASGRLAPVHGLEGTILTDSGGYQVMSLAQLRKISEEGVAFRSHIDGAEEFLSPERAMNIQRQLGSDIQMVLDECPAWPASETVHRGVSGDFRCAGPDAANRHSTKRMAVAVWHRARWSLSASAAACGEELNRNGFRTAMPSERIGRSARGQSAMFDVLEATCASHLPTTGRGT